MPRRLAFVMLLSVTACPHEPSPTVAPPPTAVSSTSASASAESPIHSAPPDDYAGIGPGFDFPAAPGSLERMRDTGDRRALRLHVWKLWAGINQTAPHGGPIWETWFPRSEVFAGVTPKSLGPKIRHFEPPRQFTTRGPRPKSVGQSLLSFVVMDAEMRRHIRENHLDSRAHLDELNAAFGNAPPEKREMPPFPSRAASVKAVWLAVKRNEPTPIPIWDDDGKPFDTAAVPPSDWTRAVVVDPTRSSIPAGETRHVPGFQGPQRVVSIDDFYHVQFTEDDIASARVALGPTLKPGDYAVLVCMHVATKEIPEWVWATFWWHDAPDSGPYGDDRPKPDEVPIPPLFRRFLMSEAYSQTLPLEKDGKAHISFNPWLEATFDGGKQSNCMSCHRQAVWPALPNGFTVERGLLPSNDARFAGRMKLDYLFAIETDSR